MILPNELGIRCDARNEFGGNTYPALREKRIGPWNFRLAVQN